MFSRWKRELTSRLREALQTGSDVTVAGNCPVKEGGFPCGCCISKEVKQWNGEGIYALKKGKRRKNTLVRKGKEKKVRLLREGSFKDGETFACKKNQGKSPDTTGTTKVIHYT